jgi:hypothetical protein
MDPVTRIANDSVDLGVPIGKLDCHPENPRTGDLDAISQSLERHGFYGVVVAQKSTGFVLAGNHRLIAARAAGLTKLDVAWLDCDDDEARRILLADNRSTDLAAYDSQKLSELLARLESSAEGLKGTLYDMGETAEQMMTYAEAHREDVLTYGHTLLSYPLDLHGQVMMALDVLDDPRILIRNQANKSDGQEEG